MGEGERDSERERCVTTCRSTFRPEHKPSCDSFSLLKSLEVGSGASMVATALAYSKFWKNNPKGVPECFTPWRAIGLAVEKGLAFSKSHGLGKLVGKEGRAALKTVELSGESLQVEVDGRRRKVNTCSLQLRPADSSFAVAAVMQQRGIFRDLSINLWDVDKRIPGGLGSYDALADFSTMTRNFGVEGILWVEIKVLLSKDFEDKLEDHRGQLKAKLVEVQTQDPRVDAVLLVATKLKPDGASWQDPETVAQLLLSGKGKEWQTVAGNSPVKIPRGKAKQKPSLQHIWDTTQHETLKLRGDRQKRKYWYLGDFLPKLGLPGKSLKKRSVAFNQTLAQKGFKEKDMVSQVQVPGKAGSLPWLASTSAIRGLYEALKFHLAWARYPCRLMGALQVRARAQRHPSAQPGYTKTLAVNL
jgi:hypothetical protein